MPPPTHQQPFKQQAQQSAQMPAFDDGAAGRSAVQTTGRLDRTPGRGVPSANQPQPANAPKKGSCMPPSIDTMGEQQRPTQITGGLLGRLRPARAA
jgi:hypothetical protein